MIERKPGEMTTLDTRGEAHEQVDKEKRYKQILETMASNLYPMSAKVIAVDMHKLGLIPTSERNFTAPRLTELSKKGVVEPVGKEVCEYTGRLVTVYRIRRE